MTPPNQPPLEDVLDMLLVTYGEPTPEAIADYAERYPVYHADLLEFAVDWAEEAHLPAPVALSTEQEDLIFVRAQSIFQNVVFEQSSPTVASAPLSLAELAKRAGKTLGDIMEAVGLDHGLITKLNGRRIRPASIPALLPSAIGQFLALPSEQVMVSWSGAPKALALSFHARRTPVVPHQEDFDIAVAKSTLSPQEQARLLRSA